MREIIPAMMTIDVTGLQLKAARQLLGLTQAEAAERAKLCAQSIKDWEHSSALVPDARVKSLARLVRALEAEGVTFRSDAVYLRDIDAATTRGTPFEHDREGITPLLPRRPSIICSTASTASRLMVRR